MRSIHVGLVLIACMQASDLMGQDTSQGAGGVTPSAPGVVSLSPASGAASTQGVPSPPGAVTSEVPAATTGTAPLDSNSPTGTATTGTSGLTMEEAAKDGNTSSLVWTAVIILLLAGLFTFMRKRKARAT